MPEGANDSPAPGGGSRSHCQGTEDFHPGGDRAEGGGSEKFEPWRDLLESAALGSGKKSQGNDSHRFLSVVSAVAVRHPCRAEDLKFAENSVDRAGGEAMKNRKENKHPDGSDDKAGDWRTDHGDNDLRP